MLAHSGRGVLFNDAELEDERHDGGVERAERSVQVPAELAPLLLIHLEKGEQMPHG